MEKSNREQRITIPTIGTMLTLSSPWVFMLHHERRNADLLKRLGIKYRHVAYGQEPYASEICFPLGTRLKVERIYIRGSSREFDSVTLRLCRGDHPTNIKIFGRFWAKLGDVNRILCVWDETTVKRESRVSPLAQLAAEAPRKSPKSRKH